jgi:thiosulfate dehydrogenase [quinone] large subunit
MNKTRICYFVARALMGFNIFMHGVVRVPKLEEWSRATADQFEATILPDQLVTMTTLAIPCIELVVGICLMFGLFTRFGIVLGWFLIFTLMLGSSLLEEWGNVFTQNLYGLYFVGLFLFVPRNYYSLDRLIRKI